MNWYVGCSDCQEPVGLPYWEWGCNCSGSPNEHQQKLLEVVNDAWNSTQWVEEP